MSQILLWHQLPVIWKSVRRIFGAGVRSWPNQVNQPFRGQVTFRQKRRSDVGCVVNWPTRPKTVKKFRATSDSRHDYPVLPHVVNREFSAACPNQIWLSDITYVWTDEGWLYLAAVLDMYSRRIVGHALSRHINSALTETALRQAIHQRQPKRRLVHHRHRGVQYAPGDYQKLLLSHGMVGSMSRTGDCWDNAPMESFFGTLKRELIHDERFTTRTEAKEIIFDYIETLYNGWRCHSSIGSVSPIDFERNYQYRKQPVLNDAC